MSNTSEKPTMYYKVVSGRNPKDGGIVLRPVVTGRRTMGTKGLVAYARNAGYMRGQQKDLEGTVGGFIQAAQDRAKAGYIINVNDWFIIGGQLRGKVDETYALTSANSYHVNITTSKDLQVGIDEFSWTRDDDTSARTKINDLMSVGGKPGFITKSNKIIGTGKNMEYLAALGDSVIASWKIGEEEHTLELTPSESDYSHMLFDWPEGLDDVPEGTEITFSFRTHAGIEGSAVQLNTKTVKVATA